MVDMQPEPFASPYSVAFIPSVFFVNLIMR